MSNPSKRRIAPAEPFRDVLLQHAARYPDLLPQDAVKLIYQSEYGAGHLVDDPAAATAALIAEYNQIRQNGQQPPESIGGGLARMHLSGLADMHWPLEMLADLFIYGANHHHGRAEGFASRLSILTQCAQEGRLPFSLAALEQFLVHWRQAGQPLLRHSDTYRQAYHPAYRVIPSAHWPLLDRLVKQRGQRILLAIDGPCASGKSSLAALLEAIFGATVIHMDDFFLPISRKTTERLAEPGGNVDYERVHAEVISPWLAGQAPCYRPFDCQMGSLLPSVQCPDTWLTIVEGAYSLHPLLSSAYDLRVFLRIHPMAQQARVLRRNGPMMLARFEGEWIPLENRYFNTLAIAEKCDLIFDAPGDDSVIR